MKIALVKDSGCLEPEHYWSTSWLDLCQKYNVTYQLFDSEKEDFVSDIFTYYPAVTLWRSSHRYHIKRKDIFQRQILDRTGLFIIPDWNMRYLYDSKIFQTYTFQLYGVPHPETHIFYVKNEARQFLEAAKYPLVVKGDSGAGSRSTRFIEMKEQGINQLEENFGPGLIVANPPYDYREKDLFYVQEYIPAPGIFRIVMVGNDVGYSFYQANRPGTITASSQGFDSYPETPRVLLDMASTINQRMRWLYMMYDFIYDSNNDRWLVLEITDTCGHGHSAKRKYTYYKNDGSWEEREDNRTPAELIFEKYIVNKAEK